ncbi:MAG: hypothetical protein WKF77_06410 [Planctomycetaceae bacterium]
MPGRRSCFPLAESPPEDAQDGQESEGQLGSPDEEADIHLSQSDPDFAKATYYA